MNRKHLSIVKFRQPVSVKPERIAFEPGVIQVDPAAVLTDDQPINEDTVRDLKASMIRDGFTTSITVRRDAEGRLHIVAGRHRLRAAIAARLKSVTARVIRSDVSLDRVQIASLEENLIRRILSEAERSADVAARDRLLADNGLTKQGDRDRAIAKQINRSDKSVRNMRRRIEVLGLDVVRSLSGTSLSSGVELDALLKIGEGRDDLIARAVVGESVSAVAVFARSRAAIKTQAHLDCNAVETAWRESGIEGRQRFVKLIGSEMQASNKRWFTTPYRDLMNDLPVEEGDDAADEWLAQRAA